MKIRKELWLVGFLMLSYATMEAQSFVETALLFSRNNPGGSARIQSLGGTQVALGGDYSSALSNPAGLGMYNRSEFTFSPAINFAKASSKYLSETTTDSKTTFHVPGFSMSFHTDYDKLVGFLGGTFTIGYSRINDFNRNVQYEGTNLNNSIIDYFLENASGRPTSQFNTNGALENTPTHLGFENYLIGDSTVIDINANPNAYFTDVLGIPFQSETIQTKGAQNQWSFSYGANYNDKLFIGGGVGLTTLRYKSRKQYKEVFQNEPLFDLLLEENLEIRGSGINASIGAIFRPIDIVQIGISATSATYYELADTYSAIMITAWDNFQYDASTILTNEQYLSDIIASDYSLTTPGKINLGATLFIGKKGFLTADVEKVNYNKARYSSITQGLSFDTDNEDIKTLYQAVYNVRSGFEYRFNAFKVRMGYAYMPEPFKTTQNNVSTSLQRITGGVGYRVEKFYIDLAIVHSYGDNSYRPYRVNSPDTPLVKYSPNSTNVMFTLGLPF
jgi:hypothetical protein